MTNEQATSRWQLAGDRPRFGDLPSVNYQERLLLGLALLFILGGTITLSLAGLAHWSAAHWILIPVWIICFGVAHWVACRYLPERDPMLLPLAGLLSGWGLLLIARLADFTFLVRQSIWLGVSIVTFSFVAARLPSLRWLRRYRYTWLVSGLALLAVTLVLGTNPSGYGPQLWLGGAIPGLGNIYIQPSEVLKLLMVAYLASYLAEKRALVVAGPQVGRIRLPSLAYLAPLLVMWGLAMVLLAWQQDLGAALLFFFTFLVMFYLSSGRWSYVVVGVGLFFITAAGAYVFLDTVALRVDIWLNPWTDPGGRAFQIVQSLIAFASGGILGQGLGQGSPSYIPAIHTDFPFAAIAEEFGLVGTVALIAAVAALTLRGARVALYARSRFRQLLTAGLATLLGLQAWIIMAGNSKLIPLTGVTLPFVSYGGSSLLSSFIALGLLMRASQDRNGGLGQGKAGLADDLLDAHRATMDGPIRHVILVLLLAFALLAMTVGYWALVQRDALQVRDENPRLVEAERRLHRGLILDRNGVALARSQPVEGSDLWQRGYVTPTVPAVGYYSLRHGVGGIEATYDAQLRGTQGRSERERFLDDLLHRQPAGRDVMLSVDAGLQQALSDLMAEHDGAAVLLDVVSGEILAMVSRPIYDPNTLDADWEQLEEDPAAPLLNRATQGLYQPGGLMGLVTLAAALEADVAGLDTRVQDPLARVPVDGVALECLRPPRGWTLVDAVAAACPGPLTDLGKELGVKVLDAGFKRWQLYTAPPLEIPAAVGVDTAQPDDRITDPGLAAVGQGQLTVTPLHMALMVATIGNEGIMPAPTLVLKVKDRHQMWQAASPPGQDRRVVENDVATELRSLLQQSVVSPSEDEIEPVENQAPEQIVGYSSIALAGAQVSVHAWYVGLAPGQAPRYAVVVLLENTGVAGTDRASQVGQEILTAALTSLSQGP